MTSHLPLVRIRTDHGSEFENSQFLKFCEEMGIKHEFSAPITPQQNGVVERKNRVLVEMARVMLNSKNFAKHSLGLHLKQGVFEVWCQTNSLCALER